MGILLILGACASGAESLPDSAGASANPTITSSSGVVITEISEGAGDTVESGNQVLVHYELTLEDGRLIDSSRDRGRPFKFVVDSGSVIPGFDESVLGMKEGGERRVIIPPELGYGESGGGGIPPNSTLLFELELIEVRPAPSS